MKSASARLAAKDLQRFRDRNRQLGHGDHRHHQSQRDIAHRLFEIGFRGKLRKNMMRHGPSMGFGRLTGQFRMAPFRAARARRSYLAQLVLCGWGDSLFRRRFGLGVAWRR